MINSTGDAERVRDGLDCPERRIHLRAWAALHTLRHTCATLAFKSGWNAKQVQMPLGHNSPAFTLATHVHLLPDDLPEPTFADASLLSAESATETDISFVSPAAP